MIPNNITLNDLLNDDKMDASERAIIFCMKKLFIENFISQNHHYAITEYNKGNYHGFKTRVNSRKYLFAPTLDLLKEKLYNYYSGNDLKEKSSIESLFPEALDWHCLENGNTEKTKRRNKELFKARIEGSDFAKMPIKDISAKDVKRFMMSFKDQITRRTLTNIKTIINFVLEYACEELEIVPFNVALGVKTNSVKVLPENRICEKAYTEFEARRLVNHLLSSKNVYDEAICFEFFLGLRNSEIEALEWQDICENSLILKRANTESGNLKTGDHAKPPKHLCKEALLLLERFRRERPDSVLIIPSKDGKRIDGDVLNKHLKKACKSLNIPYRPFYAIRSYVLTKIASTGDYEASRKTGGHEQSYIQDHYINNGLTDKNRDNIEKALNLGILSNSLKEKTS